MKKKWSKRLAVLLLSALLAALAGCAGTPDSVEDPLSDFDVDAMLPFATTDPQLLVPTPTPAPTAEWQDATTPPLAWQQEPLPGSGDDDEDDPSDIVDAPATTTSYKDLRRGESGEAVQKLQSRLKKLGYYTGKADGEFGDATVKAVKRFQIAVGMNQTGVATAALQRKLFATDAPIFEATPAPTATATRKPTYERLDRGSSGQAVWNLQSRLKKLGFYDSIVDGYFGNGTEAAVKKFERALGEEQTGIATESLQKKLYASSAPTAAPRATVQPTTSYTQLSSGDSGTQVKNLQKRLKELGYFTGTVDGEFDNATVKAVKLFQRAIGLDQTGVATVALQKRLYASNAPYYGGADDTGDDTGDTSSDYKQLAPGDSGSAVKRLQQRLKDLGYFEGDVAGNYLSKTTTAVKAFQRALGLSETGVATVALQKRLFASNAPHYKPAGGSSYEQLQEGDTGVEVKRLQSRLKELNYFAGAADGEYGPATTKAVRLFERAYGKSPTGVATPALQKKLFSSDAIAYDGDPAATATPSAEFTRLQQGDSGADVRRLQERLDELGYLDGDIDGNYGTSTITAVKRFERAYGQKQTGVATVALQRKLFSANAKPFDGSDDPEATPAPAPDEYTRLEQGDSGAAVRRLQKRLIELGYFTGEATGEFKSGTTKAVKRFEKAYGQSQTGVATVALQKKLFSEDALPYLPEDPTAAPDDGATYKKLSPGDTGAAVKRLQKRLKELGFFDGDIGGNYLDKTTTAVKAFQRAVGVEATGVATVSLQKTLFAAGAPSNDLSQTAQDETIEKLSPGDTGAQVRKLQLRLIDLGLLNDLEIVEAEYDEPTKLAVQQAQIASGYSKTDGVAYKQFLQYLYSDEAYAISEIEYGDGA